MSTAGSNRFGIAAQGVLDRLFRQSDIILAVLAITIIVFMMVPIPTWMMDMLLTINISLAFLILMAALYTDRPLQFSTFPTLLLLVTLLRLSLNVSSSRLILTAGDAGKVIDAFGNFVIGKNYIVGILIFLILVVIQFVVVTNGATRIAEVAARFTLDAMPGKQMAIDADLNTGLIDEDEAKRRRLTIQKEADFYGAMDGASKFVRGDAIAGLVIVFVNIIGGICIGIFQFHWEITKVLAVFTRLTIGDGLVTQIPAIVIAIATGILVSRSIGEEQLAQKMGKQIFLSPRGVLVVANALLLLGLATPLPKIPFLLVGIIITTVGIILLRGESKEFLMEGSASSGRVVLPSGSTPPPMLPEGKESENMVALLKIDPIELEIGYRLIPLVDAEQGGDLLERITKIRRQMALQLGLILPPIRVRDNIQLKPRDYSIKLRGIEVAHGEIHVGHYLAMNPGIDTEDLEGIKTTEPVFGLPAIWITDAHKEKAEMLGFTVFDPSTVIATHITEIVKRHSADILTRQDVQALLDNVKKEAPAVVDELVPALLSIGEIQRVFQNLLKEKISIRDLVPILESLANWARTTKDPDMLSEYARQGISRSICQFYVTPQGVLPVITLKPDLEGIISDSVMRTDQGLSMTLDPLLVQKIVQTIAKEVDKVMSKGYTQPILLCSSKIRLVLRRLTERTLPHLTILSYNEIIPGQVDLQTIGVINVAFGEEEFI